MNKALVVVDAQIDFFPEGGYSVPNSEEIIKPLNKLISYANKNGWEIFASRDWHKKEQFKDNPDKAHCIQNTKGAEYHPDLSIKKDIPIISKGSRELGEKHYNAFNGDDLSLHKLLKEHKVNKVYIGGLALDYCVKSTAIDASKYGYKTYVVKEATKPAKMSSEEVYKDLNINNVEVISLSEVIK